MADFSAIHTGERLKRTELVEGHVVDFVLFHIHLTAAEALQIRIADMRADYDTLLHTHFYGFVHDHRVAGVEAAGQIRGGNNIKNCGGVAELIIAEAFAEIGVEIDEIHKDVLSFSALF